MDSMGAFYGPDPTCATATTGRRLLQEDSLDDNPDQRDMVPIILHQSDDADSTLEAAVAAAAGGYDAAAPGDTGDVDRAAATVDVCAGFSPATRVADGYNPWDTTAAVGAYFCTTTKLPDKVTNLVMVHCCGNNVLKHYLEPAMQESLLAFCLQHFRLLVYWQASHNLACCKTSVVWSGSTNLS